MPYDEKLEKRIDKVVSRWKSRSKKKMFGGICYLLKGNMCFGIHKEYLIVRAGEPEAGKHFSKKGVRPFDITGKPMKGWLMIEGKAAADAKSLGKWLEMGKKFALSLPPK
jgi:hypothetical protein